MKIPSSEKAAKIRAYWAKELGPFFDPYAPAPPRMRSRQRKYYDDMLFLIVVEEIEKTCPNPLDMS